MRISDAHLVNSDPQLATITTDEPRGRQHSRIPLELGGPPRANTVGAATRLESARVSPPSSYSRPQSRRARSIGCAWARAREAATGDVRSGEVLAFRHRTRGDDATATPSSASRSRARTRSRQRRRRSERAIPVVAADLSLLVRLSALAESSLTPAATTVRSPPVALRVTEWHCVADRGAEHDTDFSPLYSPEYLTAVHLAEYGAGGGGGGKRSAAHARRNSSASRSRGRGRRLSYLVPEDDEAWTAAALATSAASTAAACSPHPKELAEEPSSVPARVPLWSRPRAPDDRNARARRRLASISTHLFPTPAVLGSKGEMSF